MTAERADADLLVDQSVALVSSWLRRAGELESRADRRTMDRLEGVVTDPAGVAFVMQFVDRVIRPDDHRVAADQLAAVVGERALPPFLSPLDRVLLRAGALLATRLPAIVMPLARRRMRAIVGHLVAPAEPERLTEHLAISRAGGYAMNVNLLGEAVLGEREAQRRLDALLAVVEQPHVDYVSVKISSVASQLNHWAHDASLRRITDRLRLLIDKAATTEPVTFVNFDMEEYLDLELTTQAFMQVLDEPDYRQVEAGIVLQAYLPDALPVLQDLVAWANARHREHGGTVKVRLVKGANLAMERVDAAMHGWEQAPYGTKLETDANYKRCVDWLLHQDRLAGVRLGLASHNLFDIAWTHLLAEARGLSAKVQFEMLQGMAPAQAAAVREATAEWAPDGPLLLYTPAVRDEDFDVAISYLFRRLEENAADANFLRHLFGLAPGSADFAALERGFRESVAHRNEVAVGPRRTQNRLLDPVPAYEPGEAFRNEPETDPTLRPNHEWIASVLSRTPHRVEATMTTAGDEVDEILRRARTATASWAATPAVERRSTLHRAAHELARRWGDLVATMMHEANKTFAEADVEVAEAIDFARWYGDHAVELDADERAAFSPLGVVAVVPPWNFPVAIPAGGVLASLAAGNSVVFKPAPQTPACAELVAQACWAAGVPGDVLQFVRTPDDDVGRRLVTSADAVILTGAADTADLFLSWKPDLRLFAETSGKNALVITPNADLDLAVADLVRSAFGHSGQKCSAASLAILVGDVYSSARFRRQLVDAVESLDLGAATNIQTNLAPVVGEPNERLHRGLTALEPGESWLVEPRCLDGRSLWSPGIRLGVRPGSWYHTTECFGPVLGLMAARDLDHAIAIQNSSRFGLTGGIHSLDPAEVDTWVERVEVGNAYVNRHITGAIVRRQPFGGWKRSVWGPGAKAGGPNYVAQLGRWSPIAGVDDDYVERWRDHFGVEHDPTGLFCEANVFRYRQRSGVLLRIGEDASPTDVDRVRHAAHLCGTDLVESFAADEPEHLLAARLAGLGVERVRCVGGSAGEDLRRAANELGAYVADEPVTASGRVELQHYVREQAVSRTLHRFGNLIGSVSE